MKHRLSLIAQFQVLGILLTSIVACIPIPAVLQEPPQDVPSKAAPAAPLVAPSQRSSLPLQASQPSNSQIPTATQSGLSSAVPMSPSVSEVPENRSAAACDMLGYITMTEGSAETLTYTVQCAAECKQAVTIKNTHPTERLKLFFLTTYRARPDQGGFTGERWDAQILGPGESVDMNQFNRTPHTDACPWMERDSSLVGAIPLGAECAWVEENPATALLPLQEVNNQCR